MFKLLRYFSITSFIAMVAVTAVLGMFYHRIALKNLMELGESKNIALTQALANSLWPRLAPFVTSVSGLSGDELRAHPEIAKLRQAVLAQMNGLSVVKIKVYNLAGLTVFSTQPSQIGENKSTNAGFLSARSGKVASELTHRDTFSAFEQTIEDRDIISSYIPIRRGSGPVEGVFELYYDVTPLLHRMKRTQRDVVFGVVLLLALLYVALFLIVRYADRLMKRQDSERKRAEDTLKAHYQEFQTLYGMGQTILSSLDLKTILEKTLNQILSIASLDVGNIRLFNPRGEVLQGAFRGYRDPENTHRHHTQSTDSTSGILVPKVLASGKPLVVEDVSASEGLRTFKREGVRSAVVIPIATEKEVLGVIEVGSRTPRKFQPDEIRLLEAIGNQMGIAAQKARLYDETRLRAEKLQGMSKLSRLLTSSLNPQEVFDFVVRSAAELLNAKMVRLWAEDQIRGEYLVRAVYGIERETLDPHTLFPNIRPGQGVIGGIIETKTAEFISDVREEPRWLNKHMAEALGLVSFAGVPIVMGDRVLGVLTIMTDRLREFTDEDKDLLKGFADQAAVAIANARLYEESQRSTEEQRALREFLSNLLFLDLDELLQRMTAQAALLFKADFAWLRLFDEEGKIRTRAIAGDGDVVKFMSSIEEHGKLVGRGRWMLDNRKPLAIKDMAQDSIRTSRGISAGLHGFIGAPLFSREQKPLGVIHVMTRSPRDFSQHDLDLIEQFAKGAAIAIEKARLFEETERRAQEQAGLNAIAMATSQSLHLDELLQISLDRVLDVTGREQGYIRVKDPVTGKLRLAAHRGISKEYIEVLLHRRTPGGKGDRVLESGEVLVINDPEGVPLKEETRREGRHSLIWVPLKARGKVVGLLNVTTNRPIPFAPREVELLQAIGNVIGVALENARLFQETERRNRELQSLYIVTSTVTQSLDIDTLMQTALETTIDVLGVDAGRLYVFDGKINALRLAAHWGISEDQLRGIGHYAPGEGVIGRIFAENRPFVFADVETDPNYQAMARGKLAQRGGYRSVAGLPITVKDRPIGVIYVYGRLPRNFTQEEMGLLSTIGGQIGVALENVRLFEESQKNLRRIRALREIDQAISSTLDLRNVLDVLMEKIDLVLPYSATTVRLFNQKSGLLEPIACRNLDEKEWKAEQWKGGRGIPNVVFETKAPWTVSNVQTDPRVRDTEFFRKHGLVSYLGVPLVVKDEILGVLSFYTKEEHEFTSEEIEFLSTLAGQAAIAIHNARLYEEAQTRETQLQETNRMLSALHSVAAAASRSLDLDRVLQAAIEKIREIFGFDAIRIHIYNEQTNGLLLRASFENDPDRFTSAKAFKRGEGIVGKVAESGKALVFEDIQTDPLYKQVSQIKLLPQFGYHFLAVFPIKGRMKNLGTLTCVGIAPRKLSSGEVQLLEALADQISVAIENSQLYENVRQKVQELQQKTDELERANKVKDEFLSVMSHELRTPLNVIVGYSDMIKDGMLGEVNSEQRLALEKVMSHTNDLLAMITSILYATSIEAHQVQVESHRFALGDLLGELRTAYGIYRSKPLTLIWDYPSDLPIVETDKEKLKHILQNLIHNAIKFTERGQITVSAKVLAGNGRGTTRGDQEAQFGHQPLENGGKGETVEFRVTDTGVGIPKEKLPIIFEKFRQADSSETRPHGGVGLGLYIAKNFTELLGGKIEVETQVGKGSTFTVTIPMASREGANGQSAQEKRREFIDDALTASGLPPERG